MKKSTETQEVISMILGIGRAIRKQVEEASRRGRRLSIIQIETLRIIRGHRGILMKDLAGQLYISPPSATSLVDELVKKRLAARSYDKKDRRLILISLTPKGKKGLEKSLKGKMEWIQNKIKLLTSKEQQNLLRILEKLAEENN